MDLREFFESEAETSLAAMRDAARSDPPAVEVLRQSARVLRGSSLLAREERVEGVATALATSLKEEAITTGADFRDRLVATIDDLEALIAGQAAEAALQELARAAEDRWGGAHSPTLAGAEPDSSDAEEFVSREAAAIADTMEEAVAAFQTAPADREWLEAVLKRQRALLGSVHIDAMPVVGESLRAVEDLTGLILLLDVPVKAEWLDIYRAGRDVLRAAHDALVRGEPPGPVPALSRLRTLHDELMERYAERGAGADATLASDEPDIIVEDDPDSAGPIDPPTHTGSSEA